jgi:predicted CXXCH cytochrome family protein
MYFKSKNTNYILKAVFVCILITLILPKYAHAKVSGVCSNCHTMHNSQNGTRMVLDLRSQQNNPYCFTCHNEPRQALLRLNCIGCHAQSPNGVYNIIPLDNVPQVAHHDAIDLAGGNYRYVYDGAGGDDRKGHNIHGFSGISFDSYQFLSTNPPPGYNSSYDPSPGYQGNAGDPFQIMCAGRNGCHGNRNQTGQLFAIKGSHHADDSMLKFGGAFMDSAQGNGTGDTSDFTTTGKSYRFLYNVHGAEDSDWQATVSLTDHNEYRGNTFAARTEQNWTDIRSISQLCAECHGIFHASGSSGIGTASPWLRHPVDVVLPDRGEYSAYRTYSIEAPVARPESFFVNGLSSADYQVSPDTDLVMCLSCHRAHASPYLDILRWNYDTMVVGDPSKSGGCFTCHTQKNVNP